MKNEVKEREKEIMTGMLHALSEGKVPEEYIKEWVEEIFRLEVKENFGYTYNPIYNVTEEQNSKIKIISQIQKIRNTIKNDIHFTFIYDDKNKDRIGSFKRNNKGVPKIKINLLATQIEKIKSDDVEERLQGFKSLMHTLFHELDHEEQEWMNQRKVISKETLRYARDRILKYELEKSWYSKDELTGNYHSYISENNADVEAYKKYLEIMEDDSIRDLMTIKKGKFHLARYKADVDSKDKTTHYQSYGSQERDDITIPILDDLICKKCRIDLLKKYPILTEEYNLDGTKKDAIELIRNMRKRTREILEDQELLSSEKAAIIDIRHQMYYELIYNAIERNSPEQNRQIASEIGEEKTQELFVNLIRYFQNEKETKIKSLRRMMGAQYRNQMFIEPSNNGIIEIESFRQKGKIIQANRNGFIRYMTELQPKIMNREYTFYTSDGGIINESGRQIVKRNFENIPSSGKFILEGEEFRASWLITTYLCFLSKGMQKSFLDYIKTSNISVDIKEQYKTNRKRIEDYYEDKKQLISQVSEQVFNNVEMQNIRKSKVRITSNDIRDTLRELLTDCKEATKTTAIFTPKDTLSKINEEGR